MIYLHVIEGVTQQTRETKDNAIDYVALRRRFGRTYIDNNMVSLELAEKELAENKTDLVAFGRAFLANPDLVERMRTGAPIADAPKEYWYGGDERGYIDWPVAANTPQLQHA